MYSKTRPFILFGKYFIIVYVDKVQLVCFTRPQGGKLRLEILEHWKKNSLCVCVCVCVCVCHRFSAAPCINISMGKRECVCIKSVASLLMGKVALGCYQVFFFVLNCFQVFTFRY